MGRLCEPLGLPAPLALLGVGVAASYVPGLPTIEMSPEVVLFGLLPPLLYAAALNTSLIDLRKLLTPILGLSVGLVLFTALGVALVASWLLPISFAVAFALGAIVAPPDAVATTAVARRIGRPMSASMIRSTAVAAAGLTAHGAGHAGDVTTLSVVLDFARAVAGGLIVGWLVFVAVGVVRRHLTETAADTALSFAVPFLAYVPAEKVHGSGVLAVVTAGLLLAHKAPVLQSASSRLSERINWASITFLLENAVFLLIGLQMKTIIARVEDSDLTLGRGVAVGLAVLAVCLIARPIWIFPFTLVANRRQPTSAADAAKTAAVGSWAGMRGVVTLAAALTLPEDTPLRPVLVLIALIVTVGTLLLQGFTLPALARALDVRGPDPREDALVAATVVASAVGAGLRAIESDANADPTALATIKEQSTARVNRI